jgi:xanthine dehydrogenase accessory factor
MPFWEITDIGRKHLSRLNELLIWIKGAGEMASAVAWRLYMANIRKIIMTDISRPLAVRRKVSFCEAVYDGHATVQAISAERIESADDAVKMWKKGKIAVMVDQKGEAVAGLMPHVVVDAILAKTNTGTTISEAPLVIGMGPGFIAPKDVHLVIETNRGHDLGRIITSGCAEKNTGIPGAIGGLTKERVLRAPSDGLFSANCAIGDRIRKNDTIGMVADQPVKAQIEGAVRGLIRDGIDVSKGLKIGDIDPRAQTAYCFTISDKARAISGSVLEAILRSTNV